MKKLEKRNKLQSVTAFAVGQDCTNACVQIAARNNGINPTFLCGREDSQYVQIVTPYRNYYQVAYNNV